MGHEVRVVAPSPSGPAYEEADGHSEITRVRSVRLPGKFGKQGARSSLHPSSAINRLVKEWQPDLIHGHNPFGIGQAAMKAARRNQIPYVATNHNMPENTVGNLGLFGRLIPNFAEQIWQWQIKFLNQANFVTSPTQTAIDLLLTHGLTVPNRAISNGVDLKRFNPNEPTKTLREKLRLPDKPIVMYMGRLDGEKRMDVWIDSIPLIRREIDAHFLIGGGGGEIAGLKRRAAGLRVAEHVTFAGFVDDADLSAFYRLGQVFAISSPAELQSIVTLEAMAAGLPIVACDAAALPELCKSGRNGYLFLSGNPKGMAQSTIRILQNPKMGQQMGAESRKIVEKDHDVKKMPINYEAVYKEVVQ